MKATGEVMAIDRTFEAALMKAVRSLEVGTVYGLSNKTAPQMSDIQLEEAIRVPNDERLWAITEGFRRGMELEEIHELCNVDRWFLRKLQNLVALETRLRLNGKAMARLAETPKKRVQTRGKQNLPARCPPRTCTAHGAAAAGSETRRVCRPYHR